MRVPYLFALAIGFYLIGSSLVLMAALHELARIDKILSTCFPTG